MFCSPYGIMTSTSHYFKNTMSIKQLFNLWNNPIGHKQVLALAIPMILSNLSTPMVTLVDTMVIGHLDNAHNMAAVAMGGGFYALILGCVGFLRMGTTGFTAQAFGQKKGSLLRQILLQCILLSLTLALLISLLAPSVIHLAISYAGTSEQLLQTTQHFFKLRLLGLPAALFSYTLIGWFLGTQNARIPLAIVITTNSINMLLSIWFILYLQWGAQGAASAAIIAEWCGAILGLCLVYNPLKQLNGSWSMTALKHWHTWKPLLSVNRDIFIRSVILHTVFTLVTLQGARLGENTVAANMIIINGLIISSYLLDGFAHAIEALCGRAIGAKDHQALAQVLVISGGWGLIISLIFAISFALWGQPFINIQTSIAAVRVQAYPLIIFLALLPPLSVWSYLLDGLFIGAIRAKEMRNAMLLAFILCIPLAIIAQPLANNGLWISLLSFMLLRGIILACFSYQIHRKQQWIT